MTKAGDKLIEGAKEALAVANGEIPAASIWVSGHRYIPIEEYEHLRSELSKSTPKRENGLRARARKIGISPTTLSRFERGNEPDMKTARLIGPHVGTCPCCKQSWPAVDPSQKEGGADAWP